MFYLGITAALFVAALISYLVLFFISTERSESGSVILRKESAFWKMKYYAYFLPASVNALFSGSTLGKINWSTALLHNQCEEYADRTKSLCMTFWATFALYSAVSPAMLFVYAFTAALWCVGMLVYYIGFSLLFIVSAIIATVSFPFVELWKYYKKRRLKRYEIPIPEVELNFKNATILEFSSPRIKVALDDYVNLYYAPPDGKKEVGLLADMYTGVVEYKKLAAKKNKTAKTKEKLKAKALDIMQDFSTYLCGYNFEIESDYGESTLVADYRLADTTKFYTFVKELSQFFEGHEIFDLIVEIKSLHEDLSEQVSNYAKEAGYSRYDYFDPDYEVVDDEAAEAELDKLCVEATHHFEKELDRRLLRLFSFYKKDILKFFGNTLFLSGIIQRDSLENSIAKAENEVETEKRRAEREALERKQKIAQRRRERFNHYLDLAKMLFGKVCPIIRVK